MNRHLELVKEFHTAFNAPILNTPQIPSSNRSRLRIDLLLEEVKELAQASGEIDHFKEACGKIASDDTIENNTSIIEVADALADIDYVLSGAILEFGLAEIHDEIFEHVHESNMSKLCDTMEIAEETKASYESKNIEVYIANAGNKFGVYRKEDNKVLKSIYYSPTQIKNFLPNE